MDTAWLKQSSNLSFTFSPGYLYVTFDNDGTEQRMSCSCQRTGGVSNNFGVPCIHFYACVAVFASDEKLSEEFSFFITLQQDLAASPINQIITILGQEKDGDTIEVEVLDEENFGSFLSSGNW